MHYRLWLNLLNGFLSKNMSNPKLECVDCASPPVTNVLLIVYKYSPIILFECRKKKYSNYGVYRICLDNLRASLQHLGDVRGKINW